MAKEYDENEGVWRTIAGRKVFIKTGQSLSSAMKESGKFDSVRNKNAQRKADKKAFTNNKKSDIIDNTMSISERKSEDVSKQVKDKIKEIDNPKIQDGTYDLVTGKSVDFKDGFCATFQQTGDKYTDKQYGDLIKKYANIGDGNVYIGKFMGSPEVSFHFKNRQDAIDICEKYNQISYWDVKMSLKDPTYTGTANKKYKKGKGNDYE